jgi:uncharacterized membrane protein required for colicin V production
MNSLDLVILLIMTVSLAVGALWGAVRSIFTLGAIIAGFFLAANFCQMATDNLIQLTSHPEVNVIISFIAIFIFSAVLISFIGGHLAHIVKKSKMKPLDSLLGAAMGAAVGLVVSCLILYGLLVFLPAKSPAFTMSKSFPYVSRAAALASPIAPGFFEDEFKKKMDELRAGPQKSTPPTPPAPSEKPRPSEKAKAHKKGM